MICRIQKRLRHFFCYGYKKDIFLCYTLFRKIYLLYIIGKFCGADFVRSHSRIGAQKGGGDMEQRLLVVEDDLRLQEIILDYFGSKGWTAEAVENGGEALARIAQGSWQMILLDVMLPGMNGFTICRKIREISDVPVIFLTARVQEEDELNGYSMGADDYITKPFSLPVLYAKVTALTGRVHGRTAGRQLRVGDIAVDVRSHEVYVGGVLRELPPREYELLLFFLENPNRIFSREQLLIRFWGYDFDGNERVVDNHIKKLRRLLGSSGNRIRTIRKLGYRMEVGP